MFFLFFIVIIAFRGKTFVGWCPILSKNKTRSLIKKSLANYTCLVDPLVLTIFRIKKTLLKPLQFQRKSRAYFLQRHALSGIVEHVAMSAEENKVSLVVKGDCLAALELRNLGKQGCKHPAHRMTQSSIEMVQD